MKKITLISVLIILLQTQVYSQLKNYNNNGKVKILAEKTTLSISGVDVNIIPDTENRVAGVVAAAVAILPQVVDLVFTNIKEKAKKNALAYKGEYKCSSSEERFYKNNKLATLPKLTVKRVIKKTDGNDQVAVEIELVPILSADKTAFRYYVDKCIYNYSVAKTKSKYDYIDLNLEIKIKSITIKNGEYQINDLRTTTIAIPMVYVGKTTQLIDNIYSGWITLPPRSTAKIKINDETKEDKTVEKTINDGKKETTKNVTIETKYNVENSKNLVDNTGLYEIEITANESNPYKIKAENNKSVIEISSESATGILKDFIKSLTKEKD